MPDLLVPLYKLPPRAEGEGEHAGMLVRRANPWELSPLRAFVEQHFSPAWADEASAAFARQPVCCFVAIDEGRIVGFAACEATRRAFFGPTGVAVSHRGRGLGRALLIAALWGLADFGYAYGIVGAAGPTEFYRLTVGAMVIKGSTPGIYTHLLRKDG